MKLRTINPPKPQKCSEWKCETWFKVEGRTLIEAEAHFYTCSRSEYRRTRQPVAA